MQGLNDPMNVRKTTIPWQGKVEGDGPFESFDTLVNGVRNGMLCLISAVKHHGCQTVWDIINRYAPPKDNNPTRSYAHFVANRLGIAAGVPGDPTPGVCVAITDPDLLQRMASAMAWWETHTVLDPETLQAAAAAALGHALGL